MTQIFVNLVDCCCCLFMFVVFNQIHSLLLRRFFLSLGIVPIFCCTDNHSFEVSLTESYRIFIKSNEQPTKMSKSRFEYYNSPDKDNPPSGPSSSSSTPKQVARPDGKSCIRKTIQHLLAVLVVVAAVAFTWFANYPEPPTSPILYQWEEMGSKFQYKGYDIFYIDQKTDSVNNLTLVYLHGFPTSSFDLFKIFYELKLNFARVILPDFIGFGFSSKPRFYTYSVKDQANLVIQLIESLKLDQVHLLAHDYGDSVAQELLALQSEGSLKFRIASVCMLNGGIFPEFHKPILAQKLLRVSILGTILSKFSNFFAFSVSFNSVFGPYTKPTDVQLNDLWKLVRLNDGYRVWGPILSYIDERLENEDRWVGAISRSPAPLLFIYGPADPVNPPPFDDGYRKLVHNPNIKTLPAYIGHYPQLEAPELVLRTYFEFLIQNQFIAKRIIKLPSDNNSTTTNGEQEDEHNESIHDEI